MTVLVLALALAAGPTTGDGWSVDFAPEGLLHPDYVADPRRPVFGVTGIEVEDSDIAFAGASRWGIRMGSRFGIVRVKTPWLETPIQLDGNIGFYGEFDRDSASDSLGWDGFFGMDLTWQWRDALEFQFGFAHDSSHLGDEYIETTGATRLGYTREEWRLGTRWRIDERAAVYGQYGLAKRVGNSDVMEDGRAQGGFELEGAPTLFGGRWAPFGALDLGAYEEDDWDVAYNLQAGIVRRPANGSVWRFGMEIYDGRSVIGELFQSDERHVAVGWWLEP